MSFQHHISSSLTTMWAQWFESSSPRSNGDSNRFIPSWGSLTTRYMQGPRLTYINRDKGLPTWEWVHYTLEYWTPPYSRAMTRWVPIILAILHIQCVVCPFECWDSQVSRASRSMWIAKKSRFTDNSTIERSLTDKSGNTTLGWSPQCKLPAQSRFHN